VPQLAAEFKIHPNQIRLCRDKALDSLSGVFSIGIGPDNE